MLWFVWLFSDSVPLNTAGKTGPPRASAYIWVKSGEQQYFLDTQSVPGTGFKAKLRQRCPSTQSSLFTDQSHQRRWLTSANRAGERFLGVDINTASVSPLTMKGISKGVQALLWCGCLTWALLHSGGWALSDSLQSHSPCSHAASAVLLQS